MEDGLFVANKGESKKAMEDGVFVVHPLHSNPYVNYPTTKRGDEVEGKAANAMMQGSTTMWTEIEGEIIQAEIVATAKRGTEVQNLTAIVARTTSSHNFVDKFVENVVEKPTRNSQNSSAATLASPCAADEDADSIGFPHPSVEPSTSNPLLGVPTTHEIETLAPLPNSIHQEVKFAAALQENKDSTAAVHDVVAEAVIASKPIINTAVSLGSVDDSTIVSELETSYLVAARQRNRDAAAACKNGDDTAAAQKRNGSSSAAEWTAVTVMEVAEYDDIAATSSHELGAAGAKKKDATATALTHTTLEVDLAETNKDIAVAHQGKKDATAACTSTNAVAISFLPSATASASEIKTMWLLLGLKTGISSLRIQRKKMQQLLHL
ncbi:hypothetical protein ACH5RR_037167 [Cinchona calisaya]|uniref:Uncharacterized protein n=1 Tax=Cinchona calisaya TaxID=153742 RepID=A0ABD2Y6M0_9GENT